MHIFTVYYLEENQFHILKRDEIIKGGKCNEVEN